VQDCQQEDGSLREFVKKKTSCAVELDISDESSCKIINNRATQYAKLSWKRRLLTLN